MAVVAIATDPWDVLWICIIMVAAQIVQTYVLAPKLMGDTMDMHPLTVVLAMLVGGTLGGIAGLIISIPAFAAAKIILNVFVFRRREPGIALPSLDLISQGGGPADFREST
jgi:predicted PurR-regulated permease PerM